MSDVFIDTNVLLYWEDLAHGEVYDGVQVINPFLNLEAQAAPPSP